jgi:hypothetical protein
MGKKHMGLYILEEASTKTFEKAIASSHPVEQPQ